MGARQGGKRRAKPGVAKRAKAGTPKGAARAGGADAVIEGAYALFEDGRFEEGLVALRAETKKHPNDVMMAETFAASLAEFGEQEEAIAALKRAAMLSPNEGYEKFMYLGQLLDDGEAATMCTRQGLAILEAQARAGDEDAQGQHASACCALAEQILGTADEMDDETGAQVEEIVFHCGFEQMKVRAGDFMRKGQVGDWRNWLSEEQSRRVDEWVEAHARDDDDEALPLEYSV